MTDFLLVPLVGGILLALLSGPVGSLVLWNRWAFLGDALSHAALSGIALALLMNISPVIGMICIGFCISGAVAYSHMNTKIAPSTFLAVISHGGLAIGLVLFYLQPNSNLNIMQFLIGDILTLQMMEVIFLSLVGVFILGLLFFFWRPLLACIVDADMAAISGISIVRSKLILLSTMSLLIAFSIKMVGVLLATALFVLPASSARFISNTPISMCIWSSVIGIASIILGVFLSLMLDLPTGPLIVVVALCFFLFCSMIKRVSRG